VPETSPAGPASTVALPRWALGLIVGALVVSLAVAAFLLGRVSAPAPRAQPASADADTAPPQADAYRLAEPPSGVEGATAAASLEPAATAAGGGPVPGLSPEAPPSAAQAPKGGAVDEAVKGYFAEMDELSAEVKATQDPQAVARTILDQALSGNMSALDALIAKQHALAARLGRVQPPPQCRDHHERSMRLFARAIALLERTRDAVGGQPADIAGAAAEGRAIETEAKALDALANDLRRAAGLAPVS